MPMLREAVSDDEEEEAVVMTHLEELNANGMILTRSEFEALLAERRSRIPVKRGLRRSNLKIVDNGRITKRTGYPPK